MKKLIKYVIVIVLMGGGVYYFMSYDKHIEGNNNFIESTKEFSKDAFEVSKKLIKEGKEYIDTTDILNSRDLKDSISS
ncbi:hypothetical protein OAD28_01340 [Flavobacteriales bacterium]|nr:hypothetical protein [Flavobacteriales bacterium]